MICLLNPLPWGRRGALALQGYNRGPPKQVAAAYKERSFLFYPSHIRMYMFYFDLVQNRPTRMRQDARLAGIPRPRSAKERHHPLVAHLTNSLPKPGEHAAMLLKYQPWSVMLLSNCP